MVHYRDETGIHEVPVAKVWQLIQAHSDDNTKNIHPGFLKTRTVEDKGTYVVKEYTIQTPNGPTVQRVKTTPNPPESVTLEWMTGPMAGSKLTTQYVPMGSTKTKLVCEGDFKIQGMDDRSTLKMVSEFLDMGFDEDAAYLKRMK